MSKKRTCTPALGTFFTMGNESMMECLGYTGLNFVIIDGEHGPFSTEAELRLIRVAESVGLTPYVRIADVTHKEIQRAVDIGARALIVPYLRTMDEMRRLVELAKFPPLGSRGYMRGRGSGFGFQDWAAGSVEEFMSTSNDRLLLLPQCETAECLDIIEEAVTLKGIDGIFVGPFDLSISLGIPGEFKNERFMDALDRILTACRFAEKPAFIFASDLTVARQYLQKGFDGIAYATDAAIVTESFRKIVKCI